jgi:ribokinase
MTKPIIVVGSINMDLVARTHSLPQPGETVTGTAFEMTPGGKGANQAVAVARLGYPVKMVGMVGEDVFGHALVDHLAASDVGVWAVDRVEGASGVASILVTDSGQNSIVVVPGANGHVDRAYLDKNIELIHGAGMVLVQLEIPKDTIEYLLEICSEANVQVMLDPAPAAALPAATWKRVAWFTPNETEAAFYTAKESDAPTAAKRLLDLGLRRVILKRGAQGAYFADASGQANWVQPFKVDVVDTVGAGDCFNGAFAVALMEGRSLPEAARFASAAAAISVTRRGAQESMPTRQEVEEFLNQHKGEHS